MDVRQYLIFVYSNSEKQWENKTAEIEKIEYSDSNSRYLIKYQKPREYSYGSSRVRFFQSPTALSVKNALVKVNEQHFSGYDTLYDFGEYYTLIGSSQTRTLEKGRTEIIPNIANLPSMQSLLEYYRYLAEAIKDSLGYLDYYYQKRLDLIREDSTANNFAFKLPPQQFSDNLPIIYPFGINASQKEAVANALTSQISLIQGPPGTGKTQTILNIIANLLLRKKTVAIVAGNNSATDNVFEKLETQGMSFIAAKLGSKQNKEAFFAADHTIPELSNWPLSKKAELRLIQKVKVTTQHIQSLLNDKNKLATLQQDLARIEIEKHYFDHSFEVEKLDPAKWTITHKWALPNFLSFLAEVKHYSTKGELKWPTKIRWFFKFRMINFKKLALMDEAVFRGLAAQYYDQKTVQLKAEIDALQLKLDMQDYQKSIAVLTESSMGLLQAWLYNKYSALSSQSFTESDLDNNFSAFAARFPIILSTTSSIIGCKSNDDLFDYVIVDEASQVDLLTGFLALSCAKNIIAVGDLKQLPHIPAEPLKPLSEAAEQQLKIDKTHSYNTHSLLSSLNTIFRTQAPSTLLQEHYRCHPRIIDFCSQKFYKGQLIAMTNGDNDPFKVIKTVEGNHARTPPSGKGCLNLRELEVINNEVLETDLVQDAPNSIGIISPYRGQAEAAKRHIKKHNALTMDTVYKFQGREKETIIFTTASNTTNDFVDNPNLLNVAVSRAKNKFYLVTSHKTFKAQGSNIGDLIRHIKYQSRANTITESSTISIFDCLYQDFSEALLPFLAKTKRKSKYLSEDLMRTLIEEEMEYEKFAVLDVRSNYALNLLFKIGIEFSEREKTFILHPRSHVDFIIFNKFDKSAVLGIEVDGYQSHELCPKQKERDKLKNSIFSKAGIPLLRCSTIVSDERSKLRNALNKLFETLPNSSNEQIRGNF